MIYLVGYFVNLLVM